MFTKSYKITSIVQWLLLFLLIFFSTQLKSQTIRLDCKEKPLNQVLIEIRDKHRLQFSFDDSRLSAYKISAAKKFESPDETLDFLLKNLPLEYENKNGVYLIFPIVIQPKQKNIFRLAGRFNDLRSGESLPFTHLLVNHFGVVTDHKGNFQYSSEDSIFHVQASHLGYHLLDTTIFAGLNYQFDMKPFDIRLQEIRVQGEDVVRNLKIGESAGGLRLNHKVANYLPGNGDNSIFNLLRLQPGILAAGEQSSDLIIWGSYEGQSQLLFDGFTLFGIKNYNDNISAVNPFMAKDIQVYKGGYGAEFGERVGGLVNIIGIDGDKNSTHVNLSLNNMTLNGMFSLPINNKASLALAFRQTYYELYDTGVLTFGREREGSDNNQIDSYTYPDYNFRDLNVKYSGKTKNGDTYSVSWIGANDRFSNSVTLDRTGYSAVDEKKETNYQSGGSVQYGKKWLNGTQSHFLISYSGIETQVDWFREITRRRKNGTTVKEVRINSLLMNQLGEAALKFDHQLSVSKWQQIKFGANYFYNRVKLSEDSFDIKFNDQQDSDSRISSFVENRFSLSKVAQLKLGLRADLPLKLAKIYVQPRISGTINLGDHFKLKGAWGLYNQYLVRSTSLDDLGDYRYFWVISGEGQVPVQKSAHTVLGLNFNKNGFSFSMEGYLKKTDGLTRYVHRERLRDIYTGKSKSKGLDLFAKKDWKGHSIWAAYSLSETLERFPTFIRPDYRRAIHDQRHEVKLAGLLNFKPFFFSMNYVYGSGFPYPSEPFEDGEIELPYKRFDILLVYQIIRKKVLLEAGVSILNVFNYENVKYANFIRVPDEQEISVNYQSEAVPFTPTMFINFSF